MGDRPSNRATLRDKFELEKFRSKVKSLPETEPSPQKQKTMKMEEIVKHMKHLPSYLESGKPIQDRALSFGVMDWARLEKWQYGHHKHGFVVRSNKCSPSSTISSSLFSADGSSPRSSRDQSCSPAHQKVHRVTLQSHFKSSPKEDCSPNVKSCSGNVEKFQYFREDSQQQSNRSLLDMGRSHTPPASCLKGKLKIQDESVNDPKLLFLARNAHGTTETNNNTFQSEGINSKNPQMELHFSRNHRSPSSNKTPERKRSTSSSNNSDLKPRSVSPLRRFSFSLRSTTERPDSPVSQTSARSSPLRRLLDPIFPSKEIRVDDVSRTKAKVKLDFEKEIRVDDVSSTRKQALFQTTVKNERLLFTFAVENDDILAATVTSLASSGKEDNKNLLYTFFTVHEVKKKNVRWLSQGSKSKDHGYVPNVTAQMRVSNSHRDTREFVLRSVVNPNVHPQEELEAIVVKFSRNANGEDNQERFSTTVILPGGSHGVPSKGEPSPLIDRWRSGGVCDCGGWDVGCRLKTLSNQVQYRPRSDKIHSTSNRFMLFFQGEVQNKKPVFSLSTLKDGIFSVEYNSSFSPLQAFSICISFVETQKMTQHREFRTHVREDVPLIYTPIPGIKRNATGKVISL